MWWVVLSFVASTRPMFDADKLMEWMTQRRSMNETFTATYSKAGFDSLNVRFVGSYDTPGRAYGVYVSGGYAYVADWNAGLRVIDVSDPENPVEVGYYDTPGYAHRVCISGGYAYVADNWAGLRIIDVSDPSNPVEVGHHDTPTIAVGIYVSGDYAYVTDRDAGLRVIDVSAPGNPEEVGYYDTPGWALDVYVSGDYAYVADEDSGLRVIDVSDPRNPVEVSYYETLGSAHGVYVLGDYAYVAGSDGGLRIIDVSDPSNPEEVGYYDTPGWACGVYVSGGYAYVADDDAGLQIYQFYGMGVAETSTLPDKLVLYHSWPNPFTSRTCIRFAIPQVDGCDKLHVTLSIYDVTGRLICTLVDDELSAGYYSVEWHADNDVGQRVAQGIYLCELKLQTRGLHTRCTSKLIHIR